MIIQKIGQTVQHPYCPEHRGTVSQIAANGSFQITWHEEGRKRGKPRARHWYPAAYARDHFSYPHDVEVRNESDETAYYEEMPELGKLIKHYGIEKL